MKIRNLKEPYKEMALIEQERAGNERDENKLLIDGENEGNFYWSDSLVGSAFWEKIDKGNYPTITPELKGKYPSAFKPAKFVQGEYYTREDNSYVFKADNISSNGNSVRASYYITRSVYGKGGFDLSWKPTRLATEDERKHLDACIAADKFVSKDDALKYAKRDIKAGVIYLVEDKNTSFIILAEKDCTEYAYHAGPELCISSNWYEKRGHFSDGSTYTWTMAKGDDLKWFNACREADNFMFKEDALRHTPSDTDIDKHKFKPGDWVERIKGSYAGVREGDVKQVLRCTRESLWLKGGDEDISHMSSKFKLTTEPGKHKFKVEDFEMWSPSLDVKMSGESSWKTYDIPDYYDIPGYEKQRLYHSDVHITTFGSIPKKGYTPHVAKKKKKSRIELKFKSL